MEVKTYKILEFENLIKIGTTLCHNWFRGHTKTYNSLIPSVFRDLMINDILLDYEFGLYDEFKRRAPSFAENLPVDDNNLEWLCLMQHYGIPTRLLDWSQNILVATFFAVFKDDNEDGEIWSIFPWELNNYIGYFGIPTFKSKALQFFANEPFVKSHDNLLNYLQLKNIPTTPMALYPPLKNKRFVAQSSCFTIHSSLAGMKTIPELLIDEKQLVRYIIPKLNKRDFLMKLNNLGFSYASLYPDLEGLAKTIVYNSKSIAWTQPNPPIFK